MNGLNKLCRYAVPCGVGVALLLTTSLASAERFPSTLEDYVTLYEIQSYQQCQHSSAAYQERLDKSKEILRAMKKHKGKATEAAGKQWFMAACATPGSLPATPAFSYLTDVDPSIAAAKKQKAAPTPSKTFPEPAQWQEGGYDDFVESPKNAVSDYVNETQTETQAEYDWGVDEALRSAAASMGALSDSGAGAANTGVETAKSVAVSAKKSVQGLAAKVWGGGAADGQAQEPFPEMQSAQPKQPANDFASGDEKPRKTEVVVNLNTNDSLAGYRVQIDGKRMKGERKVLFGASASIADNRAVLKVSQLDTIVGDATIEVVAPDGTRAESITVSPEKLAGPIEINVGSAQPKQPAGSFDDFAQAENELTDATAIWGPNSDTINTKITEYNNELQSARSDMRVAFGGDGTELVNIVQRIEDLVETRIGLQAMIDLSANPANHEPMGNLVSLMDEFRNSISDLNLILANADMTDKKITVAEGEQLLQRVKEVATEMKAIQ